MRRPSAAVFGVLVFLGWVRPSHAQSENPHITLFEGDEVAAAFAGLLTVTSGATFAIAEGVYASKNSWMPPTWAGFQIALAGVPITVAGATTLVLSAQSEGELLGTGMFFTSLGSWFLTHSVLSFVYYEPEAQRQGRHAFTPRGARIVAVPMANGGYGVTLDARF
jgi:hypothetical protein